MSRRALVAAVALIALAACSGSDEPSETSSPTTQVSAPSSTAVATTVVTELGPDVPFDTATTCADETVSSRADFDPQNGHYPVFLYGVNRTRQTVAFDVIQVVVDPGGRSVVNALEHTDEASVAGDVRVRLGTFGEDPALVAGTLSELLQRQGVGERIFWLAFRNGTVTQLCQELRGLPLDLAELLAGGSGGFDCGGLGTSSRADFDPQSGSYMAYLYGVDTTRGTVAFDVVQMLWGDDAVRAWQQEDHPDDPNGPPNDYLIVNAFEHTDEAVVAEGAQVRLWRPSGVMATGRSPTSSATRRPGVTPATACTG